MLNFKPINQKKFNQIVNAKIYFKNDYKGVYYSLKSLKQFIFITNIKNINLLKTKLLNRKAIFQFETIKNKFYYALIQYETNNQYLSIKKLFKERNFKNRYNNLFLYNNIIEYESKRPN